MDKYEYKVRSEEISNLIDKEKYTQAVSLADTIDWRRVKSVTMLLKIAALYRVSRRNEDSRAILLLAYERYPTNRSVMYSLCEVSIELDDIVAAIEYYKQFVKLAPKDNGVFTLRYRILETQEASLEERIEILEELKKRDYQEEWAYELAYLYHRVGLATKCVEECDDIILWFGDGPYVMKAMELKMLHVPLTQTQQAKYDGMLNNSGRNYSEDTYNNTEGYDNTQSYDNAESYDNTENYNIESYGGGNDNAENGSINGNINDNTGSYPADAIGAESGYSQQAGYDVQGSGYGQEGGYAQETYAESGYEQQAGYGVQGSGYGEDGYAQETYAESGYGQQGGYADTAYEETYPESGYGQQAGYDVQGGYAESDYGGQPYENRTDGYVQNGFVDDGYGNFSYAGSSYPDGYTGEFFAEQVYDENGNSVTPGNYDENAYTQDMYGGDGYDQGSSGGYSYADSYEENYDGAAARQVQAGDPDHGAMRREEPSDAAAPAAGDMSQYNTINLQKVVAESMKELFPDDDVFEEEQKKFYAEEIEEKVSGDTLIYENCKDFLSRRIEQMGEAPSVPEENSGHSETENRPTYTGKMSKMEDGVSEAVPEPHTGAVSKVILPGNTARIIKDEADIASLRNTTERTVEDEHIRMENNDENVYHEKSIMDLEPAEKSVSTATGPMRLDEVLEEWERKKLDNARKHQEEIKQHVLTQTGKIFAEFDNALKSGILGELEREEEESSKAPDKVSDQGFLEADVTSDIPQAPVEVQEEPEDEFDVSYVTEEEKAEKLQAEQKAEYISELGRVLSEELGSAKEEEPQQVAADNEPDVIQEVFYSEEDVPGEAVEHSDEKKNADVETAENDDDENERDVEAVPAVQTAPIPYYGDDVIYEEEEAAGEYDDQEYRDQEYHNEEYHEDDTETSADEDVMDTEPAPPAHYGRDQSIELTKRLTEKIASYEKAVSEKAVSSGNVDYVKYYGEDSTDYTESSRRNKNAADDTELFDQPVRGQDTHSELRALHKDKLKELDPEDAESIAEMAKEDALKTQEIKMNTADLSSLSEKIVATTKKEATGARREEIREFTVEEQELFENFAVTKKIKKQIIYALDNMTLSAYTGNVIITGDAGIDTVRMAKNLMKKYQAGDENFSGKAAKITGERLNHRNIQEVFDKINNGGIIIEKANGMSEEKLYEMALLLNQENLGIVVIMEDTKKEIARLLQKQAMIADYFNIRIDLMEMDNNALVAYARNYALALEYAIDELGILALYTRIANMQSGNHVVTKDEVRGIIDEAIWKSKKSKIKNFVDVLFARRYDSEDMIVLKERDFI